MCVKSRRSSSAYVVNLRWNERDTRKAFKWQFIQLYATCFRNFCWKATRRLNLRKFCSSSNACLDAIDVKRFELRSFFKLVKFDKKIYRQACSGVDGSSTDDDESHLIKSSCIAQIILKIMFLNNSDENDIKLTPRAHAG